MVKRGRAVLMILIAATTPSALADVALEEERLINRLDEPTRAKVILALAGLTMLGVLMMGLTWLAFRMLRRQFRRTDELIERQKDTPSDVAWANKPLAEDIGNE